MKKYGIIVEYNPFHNGHLYHLKQIKQNEDDCIIAVMSGNFSQRGEPTIIDKHLRTKLALTAGVDIVIELPYLYAVSHADLFSFGAISILNNCGVSEIVFGSETNDINLLSAIASIIDKPEFQEEVALNMQLGKSFPESNSIAIQKIFNHDITLDANDILAIQYIRQIKKLDLAMNYRSIKRIHNKYHDKEIREIGIASATSIREALKNKHQISHTIPNYTIETLSKHPLHFWDYYFPFLKYQIVSQNKKLSSIHDVNEGIEYALLEYIKKSDNFSSFVSNLISKRYTRGRIQRMLTHILNNVTKMEVEKLSLFSGPQYIRILGFNKEKSNVIKDLKAISKIPIITNITKINYPLVELDLRVSSIYHLTDNLQEQKIPIII